MTEKEIVQALRCCADYSCNAKCPAFPVGLDCREEMHKEVLALLERLTAENALLRAQIPQWISVEDRLPIDRLSKYLVAFRDAGGSIVDMARYFPNDGWTCNNWEVPQNLITHWMPLPEVPEEGEKA